MPGPKMLATLPQGDGNGLTSIITEMINDPKRFHVVIAIVDCKGANHDTDSGDIIPTVRVRRIEPVADPADMQIGEALMRRALDRRLGRETLPFDIEQDLEAAFKGLAGEDPDARGQ